MRLKNFVKKATAVMATAIMGLSIFSSTAYAADEGYNTYKFSALNVIVQVPDSYAGLTRTLSNNNSYLKNLGADDAAEVRAAMTATNTYLEAISKNEDKVSFEFVVSGKDAAADNLELTNLNDTDLYNEFQKYVDSSNSSVSASEKITGYEIYKSNNIIFFKTDIESESNNIKVYASKYYTVMNGKQVVIAGQSNNNALTDNQQQLLKTMVDTAEFTPVAWTPFESVGFMIFVNYFLSLGVPIIVLALIVFFLIKINKKRSKYYSR